MTIDLDALDSLVVTNDDSWADQVYDTWQQISAALRAAEKMAEDIEKHHVRMGHPDDRRYCAMCHDQAHPCPDARNAAKFRKEMGETSGINYGGPDPSVKCAYEPCTNRLRRDPRDVIQFCSKDHRKAYDQ